MQRAAMFLLAMGLIGCEQDPRVLRLTLRLPSALGCRPTEVREIELRALGDFPTREPNVLLIAPSAELAAIERFPDDAEVVTVEARGAIDDAAWMGGGIADVVTGEVVVPILQYGRACPIADARVPDGAVVLALPDGRLWIAGGDTAAITTLAPGEELAQPSALRLFAPRTRASATYLGDGLVLVAGGAPAESAVAYDNVEIFDVVNEVPTAEGFMLRARRDHAALRLPDGRVLIAGGREGPARAPWADAEWMDRDGSSASAGALEHPRFGAVLLSRERGDILLAGGAAANGEPVREIERFTDDGFEDTGVRFPPRLDAAYAALSGDRVVQLGGREGAAWTGAVEVMLEDDTVRSLGEVLPVLEAPRAVALDDGRVLVAGRDAIDRRGRAVVLDPGTLEVIEIEASRAPAAMVRWADGRVAQGDASGVSLVRVDLRTPLEAPPGTLFFTLAEDRAALALDAPDRWRVAEGGIVASTDGARFDLRALTFADFTLELTAEGPLSILLVASGRAPIELAVEDDRVTLGECSLPFSEPLRISRRADQLAIGDGTCTLDADARLGLAVRAHEDTVIRSLFVSRD